MELKISLLVFSLCTLVGLSSSWQLWKDNTMSSKKLFKTLKKSHSPSNQMIMLKPHVHRKWTTRSIKQLREQAKESDESIQKNSQAIDQLIKNIEQAKEDTEMKGETPTTLHESLNTLMELVKTRRESFSAKMEIAIEKEKRQKRGLVELINKGDEPLRNEIEDLLQRHIQEKINFRKECMHCRVKRIQELQGLSQAEKESKKRQWRNQKDEFFEKQKKELESMIERFRGE